MILEVTTVDIVDGRSAEFEEAFEQARPLVVATPGFLGLELRRCLERDDRYLLLIRWRSVTDHEVRFRRGPHYQRWQELLRPFWDSPPLVGHYELVTSAEIR